MLAWAPVTPAPLTAQHMRPSGVTVRRLHYYMNWGAALGLGAGLVYGALIQPSAGEPRRLQIALNGMIGAAVGDLAGGVVGLARRPTKDTIALVSAAVTRSPNPRIAAEIESLSGYIGLGGRIGASVGALTGAASASGTDRGIVVLYGAMVGWGAGIVVGGVTYVVQRASR